MLTSLSCLNHKTIGVRGRELGGWVTAMVAGWLGGWHSVPERAYWGTEYACRAQKGFLGYATHFQRHSVRRTGFTGTEGIFGTRNSLLWYGRDIRCRRGASLVRIRHAVLKNVFP